MSKEDVLRKAMLNPTEPWAREFFNDHADVVHSLITTAWYCVHSSGPSLQREQLRDELDRFERSPTPPPPQVKSNVSARCPRCHDTCTADTEESARREYERHFRNRHQRYK